MFCFWWTRALISRLTLNAATFEHESCRRAVNSTSDGKFMQMSAIGKLVSVFGFSRYSGGGGKMISEDFYPHWMGFTGVKLGNLISHNLFWTGFINKRKPPQSNFYGVFSSSHTGTAQTVRSADPGCLQVIKSPRFVCKYLEFLQISEY